MNSRRTNRTILNDRSGSVVVEFALVIPMLIALLLALFDFVPSLMARMKFNTATQTVADLVTQAALLQVSGIQNYYGAGADVLFPFSSTPLAMRITNVASDGNNNAFVYWSCGQSHLPPLQAKSSVDAKTAGIDPGQLLLLTNTPSSGPGTYTQDGTNTSFIMVEAIYSYSAPAQLFYPGVQSLKATAYSIPRVSTYIAPTYPQANFTAPAPTKTSQTMAVPGSYLGTNLDLTCNVSY